MKTIQMRMSTGCLFFTCYNKGSWPHSLVFGRDSQAVGRVGSFLAENWEGSGLPWGSWREGKQKWGLLCDWLGERIWFSLVGPTLEVGAKLGMLSVTNPVLDIFGSIVYRSYCLASWIVTRDSGLTSQKSDLQRAGWLPGLVVEKMGCRLWVRILLPYTGWDKIDLQLFIWKII